MGALFRKENMATAADTEKHGASPKLPPKEALMTCGHVEIYR